MPPYACVLLIALTFVAAGCGVQSPPVQPQAMSAALTFETLPERAGERPRTTPTNPHTQLTQQPKDLTYIRALYDWAFQLGHIDKKPSLVSVPGAQAMFMHHEHSCDRCNAFMAGTEFAHFHPHPDHSLHLGLPKPDAAFVIAQGWGEWHPLIERGFLPPNIIMLYAPRDAQEQEVCRLVLERSYQFAKGELE